MSALHGYPRPQLERAEWYRPRRRVGVLPRPRRGLESSPTSRIGTRAFAFRSRPETPASGIGNTGFFRACWYRRQFDAPEAAPRRAADPAFLRRGLCAKVWVNGCRRGRARRAATRPSAPISPNTCDPAGPQTDRRMRVRRPRRTFPSRAAKQDWQLHPHSIWYPRTTGIWQPVWMERVSRHLHRPGPLDAECRAMGDRLRGLARRRAPR